MPAAKSSKEAPTIDGLMERASRQLVHRDYFACEQTALAALQMALAASDYERAARIVMPLQEARRQKRDLAFDAQHIERVVDCVPPAESIRPGCYLFEPPRVGIEGRTLREEADRRGIPVIVVVREPTTRSGQWPIVAIGPCTIRTQVPPPSPRARTGGRRASRPTEAGLPDPEWFLRANEALGDAALAQLKDEPTAATRVPLLMDRLMALPDHEKLHQALEDACRRAARDELRLARRRPTAPPAIPAFDDQND